MNNSLSQQNRSKAKSFGLAQLLVVTLACLLCPAGLFAAPTFVQQNSATPQSPTATVAVAFTTAQTAGDLNVVVVGWNDTTATVQSVKDSAGNTYSLAIGPTSGTALRQSIYYAPNILAGANTVTVTFSQAAAYPDIRILEYRGVNAVDVTAGAVGSSTAASSGAATTTVASELVFGADIVQTTTASAGSGFTSRVITAQDGDIAEDKVVTATGSNSATATLGSAGPWVMQMVTFFALSGPAPTVTSVSPNSGTTAGGTAVTITGANFATGATVTFGSAAATSVVVVSGTQITATTPAGTAGAALVTVSNPGGQSGALAGGFTYIAPPTVTSVSPNNGPVAGGTAVTITGTNFAAGATVTLGGTAATNVVVASSTTITATTPAHAAGAVTATVTNSNGLSGNLASGFTYIAPPTVTGVSPSSGSTAGGTAVTISGTNFATGAGVTFGATAATNVVVVSSTTITATTPAGSAGAVTVTVTNPGSLSGSLASGYTYVVTPTVTSVSPNNGPTSGGTAVTVTGTNFVSGATVLFGSTAATNVVVVSATQITATTPAGSAGVVTVTVTSNGQSGSLANGFTYNGSVTITFVEQNSATPQSPTATVAVAFTTAQTAGDLNVVVVGWNDTTATVQSVKDSAGNTYSLAIGPTSGTALRQSIYYAPNILAGANTVTVTFSQAAAYPDIRILEYRGVNAVDVTAGAVGSSTAASSGAATTTVASELVFGADIVQTTTASAGSGFTSRVITAQDGDIAEDKVVTATGSNSATATLGSAGPWVMQMVTFFALSGPAPTVTSVSPNSGTTAGGTAVTITGANFATGATVTFGSAAATSVVVVSGTQITATTPAGTAGAALVTVSNPGGQSGALAGGFTYIAPPTVTSVSPNNGPVAGGTAVTITGTNFAAGATVTLGGTAATNVVVASSTTITATTPAHAAGAVTATVTNSNGLSGNLASGFTYIAPPTVTGVSPSSGSTAGGTAVTISGTNFATGAGVTFGATAATNVVVVSSTTITATTPAGSAGAVTVTVTNPGSLSGSLASGYTYVVTPTVTSVSPNNGPPAGGTSVTITGTNFAAEATVTFGSAAATNVVVMSATQITATTPAGGGAVTVTVTSNGQSGSLASGFIYNGAPTAPGSLTAGKAPVPIVQNVQGYYNSTFLTTHTTAAFNSTGGDLIVVCASSHFGVTFTPSDNLGNSWISIAGPTTTALGFDLRTQIWYAPNPIVGSAQTITMNLSQSMPLVMSIIVVHGSNTSSPIDAISLIGSDNGTQSLNVTSPTITTAYANDLLIGFSKVSAGATFQPGTGFTQQAAASSNFLDAETGTAAAPGNYAASFTIDSAQTWEAAVAAVSNSPNQTTLSWTASTETGGTISEYLVERCNGSGCNSFVQVGTTASTSYNDTGLTASTSYSYRVRAQDTNGNDGPYSSVVTVTTPAAIPSLPGNLIATSPSSTTIDLSWIASTETGGTVNQYNVQRCAAASCTNFVEIGTSSGTTYNDTGLTNGTSYTYRLQAVDAQDNVSPYSNLASATAATPDTQPPTAPSNLTATAASTSQINLTWTASTDNVGVSDYFIERCTGAGCTLFFRVAVASGTTYSDTNLSADTTYEYRVRATDAAGNLSAYSNVVSATTLTSGTPSFTLSASPGSLSVAPGSQGSSTITSTLSNGFSSAVSLTASGMPSGTTVSFNPSTIAAPGSGNSTMTVAVGSGTAVGSYTITITGNGGGIQQTTTVPLTVGTSLISYVQGNYATPQASEASVPVKFNVAQSAGDLNVVAVGWNDSTASVSAVTDTSGNAYTLAEGPTSISGVASQSIYYAKNIVAAAAGANTVTITFSTAAKYPDVRILEYSGADQVNPVDVTSANTGDSASSSSGSVSTTNPLDLIFGANLVQTLTTGAGSGFTSRLLTSPDGDIAEDMMVTATGSYTATAPVSPAGQWIMQMVAFRTPTGLSTPVASLSSTSLSFGSVTTGTSSSPQPVTLLNTGSATLAISSVGTLNGNTGDFSQTNNCGFALAPTLSCTINVTFTPSDTGQRGSSIAINDNGPGSPQVISLSGTGTGFGVTPRSAVLTFTMTQQFTASGSVTWSVDGIVGGSSTTGTISGTGLYTPPASTGTHTVTATAGGNQASSTVYISNYPGTYTFHNDNMRTGQNTSETVLTPANVNPIQFGKLFSYSLDGIAFASPLYVAGVSIPSNGIHNVVYVASENDSVYAFDADGLSSSPLWHVNFLKSGVTTVPCADVGECGDIPVQIGITSTPVIDPTSGTIYVVAKTKESSTYVQRLHALDITTGAEKFGGPVVLTASAPGTGVDSSGGKETFNALRENQRPGLLLSNGVLYFAFGSHGDNSPWHGWVLGYNATTLQQVLVYNDTPNGGYGGGGIWQCGGGLATDTTGDLYFTTSNGDFDVNTGGIDYGDSIMKLSTSGTVVDYFTPYNQSNLSANNLDLGSAGPVLLVDQTGGPYPHLLVSAGKGGTIYVINRDNMGHYNSNSDNQIVQELVGALPNGDAEVGNFSAPVYFNGYVYFAAVNDTLRAFQLNNGLLSTGPTSQSAAIYPLRGGAFAVSANGSSNGILWAIQTNGASPDNPNAPGVLYAYDATNLADELYDSTEAGTRDTMDFAAKFSIPLVANGKVFVGSQSELTAYGLLP